MSKIHRNRHMYIYICVCVCVSKCLYYVHHIVQKIIHVHLDTSGDDMSLKKYA